MASVSRKSERSGRIESERLYMRALADADCTDSYVAWLNDPKVNRFLETRHRVQDLGAVRDFVRAVNERSNEFLFGIFLKENDRHIGNIKVGPIGLHHPLADVSLLIGARDVWGEGFASEAIRAISRHAFEQLGVRKLAAGMYAANEGSYRAFIKAGYSLEGVRRAHYILDGEMSDLMEVGLTVDELECG